MTKQNIALKNKAFLLKPSAKDYIWGGNRLNKDFNKNINMLPLAETWECSTHKDGVSVVDSGEYKGRLLSEVIKKHPEYLGDKYSLSGDLPILVKLIDAREDLSVQVHPNDEYAIENENSIGKTEMWYVLDADKGTRLVYGFHRDMDRETLKNSIKDGTVEKYLQKVKVEPDDVFYIEAGRVHAIGAGALIAEIQQNSNLTYRLYDYNRADSSGNKRELHIDKALDVADLKSSAEPRQPMRVLKYKRGLASELLCRCKYFNVERILLNVNDYRDISGFSMDNLSFKVLLCIDGSGILTGDRTGDIEFCKGRCIFVPANSEPLKIMGSATILKING